MTSPPTALRTRVSTTLSPAPGERGGLLGHRTSISSSRLTVRSRLSARQANSIRGCGPLSSAVTSVPRIVTRSAPPSPVTVARDPPGGTTRSCRGPPPAPPPSGGGRPRPPRGAGRRAHGWPPLLPPPRDLHPAWRDCRFADR